MVKIALVSCGTEYSGIQKEIEKLTAMNVEEFEVVVKNVYVPQRGE